MTGFAEDLADNFDPHEGIRVMMCALADYNVGGDVTWPLRTIRHIVLFYFRTLSMTYPRMEATAKCHVCRLLVHEACKRHVSGDLERYEAHKFEFVVKVVEMTEREDTDNDAMCAVSSLRVQ